MATASFPSIAKAAFCFLKRDYGFTVDSTSAPFGIETWVRYVNRRKGVGVHVEFSAPDRRVDITLYRLLDGEFVRLNDQNLYCADILDVIDEGHWIPPLSERVDASTKSAEIARLLKAYVIECAEMLKREVPDILSGDFSRWENLERAILDKQRRRA